MEHRAARVARLLEQNGVIRSATAFEIYARRHPKRRLQAGEYFFNKPISGHDVFWQIADGHVFEQPFTVREGETMFDIARDLEAGKYMTAAEFLTAAKNPELIHDLAPNAKTLEGYLYPATYNLPRHPVANELTAEMVKKFKEEWLRIRTAAPIAPASGLTEHLVTLASLVERETPRPEERPLVAGIFENRSVEKYAIAVRSDGDLRAGTKRAIQRNADRSGFADRFAVQHVPAHGIAAGADRESGARNR